MKTKIKLIGFTPLEYGVDRYFLQFLKSDPKFEIVEYDADLVITNLFYYEKARQAHPKAKILVFSGENLLYKFKKRMRYLRKLNLEHTFLPRFLPNQLLHKSILQDISNPNTFWILCNAIKQSNILKFPYFFDVFLHYIEKLIEVKTQKLYHHKQKFCAFVVANPNALDRIKFFKKLSKYKKVDSYGPVLNNLKVPVHLLRKYKYDHIPLEKALAAKHYGHVTTSYLLNQELFRSYKFVICFENSYAEDYITEKLLNVMVANSIGIYRGAPNVGEFFNPKSFVNYDDYGSDTKMIEKIIELDRDDEKYQAMLAEPFFVNNELPTRIKTAEQNLENFISNIIEQ